MYIIVALVIILLALILIRYLQAPSPAENKDSACQEEFVIRGGTAFTSGMDVFDTAAVSELQAVEPRPQEDMQIQESLSSYTVQDQPLVWLSKEKDKAYVDKQYLSDLKVLDATNLREDSIIGTVKTPLLEAWEAKKIVRFLLDAEIIRTYIHLEANLCVTKETETDELYEVHFDAVHSYCTNECVEKPYSFSVQIDKSTGEVMVRNKDIFSIDTFSSLKYSEKGKEASS